MRPPLLFAALFIILMLVYRALVDVIGTGATYAIQTAMVLGLLAALTLWRRRKH
jgi:MYXO-CTERM domain-containing protein